MSKGKRKPYATPRLVTRPMTSEALEHWQHGQASLIRARVLDSVQHIDCNAETRIRIYVTMFAFGNGVLALTEDGEGLFDRNSLADVIRDGPARVARKICERCEQPAAFEFADGARLCLDHFQDDFEVLAEPAPEPRSICDYDGCPDAAAFIVGAHMLCPRHAIAYAERTRP